MGLGDGCGEWVCVIGVCVYDRLGYVHGVYMVYRYVWVRPSIMIRQPSLKIADRIVFEHPRRSRAENSEDCEWNQSMCGCGLL